MEQDPDRPLPEERVQTITRSDIALLRTAARNGWNVPDELRTEAVWQLTKILKRSKKERHRISAALALAYFDRTDILALRLALEHSKHDLAARIAGGDDNGDDDYIIDLSPPKALDAPDSPHSTDGATA